MSSNIWTNIFSTNVLLLQYCLYAVYYHKTDVSIAMKTELELAVLLLLQADELEYTFKRLVDGLAHTREAARPGFSLALGQVSRYQGRFHPNAIACLVVYI